MKPIIGITVNYVKDDRAGTETHIGGKGQRWQMLAQDYITSVQAAGGVPVMLPVLDDGDDWTEYSRFLDGIIFSGGCDISPLSYGEAMDGAVGTVIRERDRQELELMKTFLADSDIPILGICRGCQLLNVACGGTLVQDMEIGKTGNHFFPEQEMQVPTHMIVTEEGTRIRSLMGDSAPVNSYHHQCVAKCAPTLRVTATDGRGVPECLEMPGRTGFTLGVQWHPEGMVLTDPAQRRLMEAFVKAAESRKSQGTK